MRKAILPGNPDGFSSSAQPPKIEKPQKLIGPAQAAGKLRWDPPLLGDWLKSVTETEQFLLKNLLPCDSNILISGSPKISFKSWIVKCMALAITSGKTIGPFEPVNPDGEHVLYLYAEGARIGTRNRYEMLERGLSVPAFDNPKYHFAHREPISLQDKEWVDKICEHIAYYKDKLIIIDTLAMHAGSDENNAKDTAEVVKVFNQFRDLGASVMFVHHLRKDIYVPKGQEKHDVDQDVRGSTAIIGFYDQHWAIRKRSKKQEYNDLVVRSKEAEELAYEMYWTFKQRTEPGTGLASFELLPVDEEKTKAEMKEDILLDLMPGEEYSKKRLKEISEMPWSELEDLIEDLVNEGKLEVKGESFIAKGGA